MRQTPILTSYVSLLFQPRSFHGALWIGHNTLGCISDVFGVFLGHLRNSPVLEAPLVQKYPCDLRQAHESKEEVGGSQSVPKSVPSNGYESTKTGETRGAEVLESIQNVARPNDKTPSGPYHARAHQSDALC